MREPRKRDGFAAAAGSLLAGAVLCAVAAVLAYLTGDDILVNDQGYFIRTHVDAVWVLGGLALTMLVAAYVVGSERER